MYTNRMDHDYDIPEPIANPGAHIAEPQMEVPNAVYAKLEPYR